MRTIRTLKLALLLLLFVAGPIQANPDFTELEKLVPEELKERNTPGAVIAIVSGDRVVYQKAFGLANIETGAPMPGKSGKIEFIFTELYAAKRVP
jgi:CubicO group peptidase (beta-lactamase class C family)